MSEEIVSPILALGASAAAALSVGIALASGTPAAHQLRAFVAARGRWLAFAVAALAMAGSLYYSEVVGFLPCEFCWYQRIAMYPLAVVGLVAATTRDERAWRYVIPIAVIGLALSMYHYQMELFPEQATACSGGVSCAVRHVEVLGFISIPFMAGLSFISVVALHLAMLRAMPRANRSED
ncbi:MAG: disulfide bond formation protein B [Chloroflexi bacterium]|nr:disulfide bond formation protein B [Chloroflexota bacterium]